MTASFPSLEMDGGKAVVSYTYVCSMCFAVSGQINGRFDKKPSQLFFIFYCHIFFKTSIGNTFFEINVLSYCYCDIQNSRTRIHYCFENFI